MNVETTTTGSEPQPELPFDPVETEEEEQEDAPEDMEAGQSPNVSDYEESDWDDLERLIAEENAEDAPADAPPVEPAEVATAPTSNAESPEEAPEEEEEEQAADEASAPPIPPGTPAFGGFEYQYTASGRMILHHPQLGGVYIDDNGAPILRDGASAEEKSVYILARTELLAHQQNSQKEAEARKATFETQVVQAQGIIPQAREAVKKDALESLAFLGDRADAAAEMIATEFQAQVDSLISQGAAYFKKEYPHLSSEDATRVAWSQLSQSDLELAHTRGQNAAMVKLMKGTPAAPVTAEARVPIPQGRPVRASIQGGSVTATANEGGNTVDASALDPKLVSIFGKEVAAAISKGGTK